MGTVRSLDTALRYCERLARQLHATVRSFDKQIIQQIHENVFLILVPRRSIAEYALSIVHAVGTVRSLDTAISGYCKRSTQLLHATARSFDKQIMQQIHENVFLIPDSPFRDPGNA